MAIFSDFDPVHPSDQPVCPGPAHEPGFEAIFNAEPECVKVLSPSGRILQMNQAGLNILQASSPSQVVGRDMLDFVEPNHHEGVRNCLMNVLGGQSVTCSFEVISLKGERRWLESHVVLLHGTPSPAEILAVTRDITKTHLAERALRDSEERFRQMAENIPEVFWMMDYGSRKMLYVSPAYERVWGRSCESLCSNPRDWLDSVHPDDQKRVQNTLLEVEKGVFNAEYRILREDGSIRWIHDRAFPVFDENGKVYRVAGLATDISVSKAAEDKIHRLNRLYRFSSRINHAIIHQHTPEELFHEACRIAVEEGHLEMAWVGLLQAETGELRPVTASGRVDGYLDSFALPVEGSPGTRGPAAAAFLKGRPAVANDIETDPEFLTKDAALERGYRSCAAFPLMPFSRKEGVLVMYANQPNFFDSEEIALLERLAENLAFAMETTEKERKREEAEIALAENEERFRLILENSNDLICELDPHGIFLYASPNFESILGYAPASLLKQDAFRAVHEEDLSFVKELFKHANAGATFRYRHADGTWRWFESSSRRFRTSMGEERVVVISRNVTERRQAEAERDGLEGKLRQAQRMEALGTLAGGIAHDFNNILCAIIGNVELARGELPAGHESVEPLDESLQAANRATDLVRQILTFSRRKEQERRVTDIGSLTREAVKLVRAALPASIEIRSSIPSSLPPILADPSQIHQVLMNLATNAKYAMRESGGTLSITLSPAIISESTARSNPGLSAGKFLKLKITDTGEGMTADVLERAFEPFFTTKPTGEGTGLGLSVVHGIVKAHEGAIFAASELGRGSTFEVYFPTAATVPAPSPILEAAPKGHGEAILFIDDEESICRLAENALRRCGYAPQSMASAAEALAIFKASPNRFSAIVTDLTMPGMSGLSVAKQVKQLKPGIPVILITGFAGGMPAESLRAFGVDEVLPKPFTKEDLAHALARHLRTP